MKKLLTILLLWSGLAMAQTTPTNPVQLTTNTAYLEPSTGLHWYYNGTTYLWSPYYTKSQIDAIVAAGVRSFNTRTGDVVPLTGDYAAFYPLLNGTGATGTWGIGITGNSGTVTNGVYTTTFNGLGDARYPLLSGSYANPSWITSLPYSKITGTPSSLPPSGAAGGDLSGTYPNPTINTINSITKSFYDPTSSIQTQLNGKEASISAGTTLQYYRGDKTFQTLNTAAVPELTNLYYTNARGIGSTLTGYTSGPGTITSSDNILQAIQKLNGNIGALVTGVSSVSGTTNRVTSTGGTTPVIDISSTFEGLLGKVANPLSQFASTTSAQLRTVLSDETGTGFAYFQGGDIGTPSAGVATNITGLPLTTGVTGVLPIANGGTNASSAGITAINNISGRSYTGFSGTGNLIGSASPTFTGTVTTGNVQPATTNASNSGSTSLRWGHVYGNVGDFSGGVVTTALDLTTGGSIANSGTITPYANNASNLGAALFRWGHIYVTDLDIAGSATFGSSITSTNYGWFGGSTINSGVYASAQDGSFGGLILRNSAGVDHWKLYQFISGAGAIGNLEIRNEIANNSPLIIDKTTGNVTLLGSLTASLLKAIPVAFASLPASPTEGMMIPISDSTTNTWGATIAGSGANHVMGYYNGTNWTVMAK